MPSIKSLKPRSHTNYNMFFFSNDAIKFYHQRCRENNKWKNICFSQQLTTLRNQSPKHHIWKYHVPSPKTTNTRSPLSSGDAIRVATTTRASFTWPCQSQQSTTEMFFVFKWFYKIQSTTFSQKQQIWNLLCFQIMSSTMTLRKFCQQPSC